MTTNAYATSHTDADAAATPMTPLRRRMIEDMVLRRLAPTTQKHYVRAVAMFAKHFNASPDTLDYEDVRSFRLHLVETGHNVAYVNQVLTALQFLPAHAWALRRSVDDPARQRHAAQAARHPHA